MVSPLVMCSHQKFMWNGEWEAKELRVFDKSTGKRNFKFKLLCSIISLGNYSCVGLRYGKHETIWWKYPNRVHEKFEVELILKCWWQGVHNFSTGGNWNLYYSGSCFGSLLGSTNHFFWGGIFFFFCTDGRISGS